MALLKGAWQIIFVHHFLVAWTSAHQISAHNISVLSGGSQSPRRRDFVRSLIADDVCLSANAVSVGARLCALQLLSSTASKRLRTMEIKANSGPQVGGQVHARKAHEFENSTMVVPGAAPARSGRRGARFTGLFPGRAEGSIVSTASKGLLARPAALQSSMSASASSHERTNLGSRSLQEFGDHDRGVAELDAAAGHRLNGLAVVLLLCAATITALVLCFWPGSGEEKLSPRTPRNTPRNSPRTVLEGLEAVSWSAPISRQVSEEARPFGSVLEGFGPAASTVLEGMPGQVSRKTEPDTSSVTLLSFRETTTNIFSLYVGAGILQLPFAFTLAGWVCAGVIFMVTGIFGFSGVAVLDVLRGLEKREPELQGTDVRDFIYVGRKAFGRVGSTVISSIITLELGLYGSYFLILMVRNLQTLLPEQVLATWLHLSILGIIGTALTFASARGLAWLNSVFGLFSLFACLAMLVVGGASLPEHTEPAQRPVFTDTPGLLQAFGVICVMFAGAPCVPSIYENCGPKEDFNKAFLAGLILAGTFYALVGGVGFFLYGPNSAELFTLNVGQSLDGTPLPGMGWVRPVVCLAITVKLMVVFPFVLDPVVAVFYRCQEESSQACQVITKTVIGTVITVIAIVFQEKLTPFADLLGVLITGLTCVIIPLACYLAIEGKNAGVFKLFVVVLILLTGATLAAVGTVYSASALVSNSGGKEESVRML